MSPDSKGCMDRNECLDMPCMNGATCINLEPRLRYRCICPDGFWGENCELVQEGQTLKLSMGALAAILVCLLIILSEHRTIESPPQNRNIYSKYATTTFSYNQAISALANAQRFSVYVVTFFKVNQLVAVNFMQIPFHFTINSTFQRPLCTLVLFDHLMLYHL